MKTILLLLLRLSGLVSVFRFLNRKKVTILMLHGVDGGHENVDWQPLWPRLDVEDLDSVLGQLQAHYHFVSLSDAVAMLAGKKTVVDNAIALTFDDGYRNNIDVALPILKKFNAPATFFVATGFVETGRAYWIDRLDYALQKAPDTARHLMVDDFNFDLRGLDRDGLQEKYQQLRLDVKKSCDKDEQMLAVFDAMAGSLEAAAGTTISAILVDDAFASVATWSELRSAANEGVGIGSHTVDHFRLDAVDRDVIDRELRTSKEVLEQRLGRDCDYFCYPNGSFNELVVDRTWAAGYKAAVTTLAGLNAPGDNLFTLKRYAFPRKSTALENLFAISGISEWRPVRWLLGGPG